MIYLDGEQLDKTKLKNYIGCRCQYLLRKDIDKTGRGYFFPRYGVITFANKRQIDFDDAQEFHSIPSDLREIVLLED